MAPVEKPPLRVLVANEDRGRLEEIAGVTERLGHEVVAREIDVADVAAAAAEVRPDVAIVGLPDHHADHALSMIGEIIAEATCPVIAVTEGEDPEFVRQAAVTGIFAYASSFSPEALTGAIDVALRRFDQAVELEGAIARRAIIERAKGVLMERYSLDERAAFAMIRDESRKTGTKVLAVADALLQSHPLLREPARPSNA
jgi:AmiR/NasT family two-component response regulator